MSQGSSELIVDSAWDLLQDGLSRYEPDLISVAFDSLREMERPEDPANQFGFLLGRLALAHEPIFTTWGQEGTVGRPELDLVVNNLTEFLKDHNCGAAGMRPIENTAIFAGLTSLLINRFQGGDDHIAFPTPPSNHLVKFRDSAGRGRRNLLILRPDGELVPALATGSTAKLNLDSSRQAQGVLALGLIGPISDFASKRPDGTPALFAGSQVHNRGTEWIDYLSGLTVADRLEPPEQNLIDDVSQHLKGLIDDYQFRAATT